LIKGKRGCPKFRLRWKGPYEVLQRLSDLNYLIRISRNKEVVVNVNKMKRCYRRVAPSPPTRGDIPTQDPGEDGRQNMAELEEVTSLVPYDHFDNSGSFVPASPAVVEEETKGRTQDPTWDPGRHEEIPIAVDGAFDLGEESGARYWSRSRQSEQVGGEGTNTEAAEADPPPSSVVETASGLENFGERCTAPEV
jgi:hypothetical protein